MKKQLLEKIEQTLKNEKIELCGGKLLFEDETERIGAKFENLNYSDLNKFLNNKYLEINQTYEPYRTQIAYINFLLNEILNLYVENGMTTLSTEEIHKIDTVEIEANIKEHLENLKSFKIKSSQFSAISLDKKLKQNIYTINSNDTITEQKQKKQKKRDIIFKALKYLTAYNVLSLEKVPNEIYNIYNLNLENWFEQQQYSLFDTSILKDIMPLLISFLKYNAPNKVNHFLSKIDNIVEFLYTPPKNYEKYSTIENYIIKTHNYNLLLTFETFDNEIIKILDNNSMFEDVKILNIKVDENNNKYLKFKTTDEEDFIDSKIYEIPIEKIYRIYIDDKNEDNSVWLESKKSYVIYNNIYKDKIKNSNYPKEANLYKTILEADANMLKFFNIKPLKNQKIYKTKNDKIELIKLENLDININNSNIYLTANDTKENILNVVQKNIPYIKILQPTVLFDNLNEILKQYVNCE